MEYVSQLLTAFVSPVNCVGGLAHDVLQSVGTFFSCFGGNLGYMAGVSGNAINHVATVSGDAIVGGASAVTTAVTSIGG